MAARIAVGVAVLLTAAGLAVVLSQRAPRMAGTNDVMLSGFVVEVPAGAKACQRGEVAFADTAGMRLFIGTFGRNHAGPVALELLRADGSVITRGTALVREGDNVVRVHRVARTEIGASLCLRNVGPGRIALGGFGAMQDRLVLGHTPVQGGIRVEYVRPGRERWLDVLGTVTHRFRIGKAPWIGGWSVVLAFAALVGAWVLALRLVLRDPQR
jgi:hypothetical protein